MGPKWDNCNTMGAETGDDCTDGHHGNHGNVGEDPPTVQCWRFMLPQLWDLVSISTSVWSSFNACVGEKTVILRMGRSVLLKLLAFWDGPSLTDSHWFRVGIIIPIVDLNHPECWSNCSVSQLLPPQSVLDPLSLLLTFDVRVRIPRRSD